MTAHVYTSEHYFTLAALHFLIRCILHFDDYMSLQADICTVKQWSVLDTFNSSSVRKGFVMLLSHYR